MPKKRPTKRSIIRPEILRFAMAMELEVRDSTDVLNITRMNSRDCLDRLWNRMRDLELATGGRGHQAIQDSDQKKLVSWQVAELANRAMMLWYSVRR